MTGIGAAKALRKINLVAISSVNIVDNASVLSIIFIDGAVQAECLGEFKGR